MFSFLFAEKIDKLTNSIEDSISGISYNTLVLPLEKEDLKVITIKNGWKFNWRTEFNATNTKTYKIVTENNKSEIQGLISIEDRKDHIFVTLIESAPQNFAKNKKYYGVAGNMFAFACKQSFEMGYDGFTAFEAKTNLIEHYQEQFGAKCIYRNKMAIATENAQKLVNLYFK